MSNINFYKLWHQELSKQNQKDVPGDFMNLESIPCTKSLERYTFIVQNYFEFLS